MKKILILGCPGSGKSTFAGLLRDCTKLPLIHLDLIWWKPDRTHISRPEFDEKLALAMQADSWILDGDYSRTYKVRMAACDTVFFLDYSEEECISGILGRTGKQRPDFPWTDSTPDPQLLDEVRRYRAEKRLLVIGLLAQYPTKEQFHFHSRAEAAAWLEEFKSKNKKSEENHAEESTCYH